MPTEQAIQALLEQQRAHFFSGRTLPVQARIQALDRLEQAILDHEEDLYQALQADLGKSRMEAVLGEIAMCADMCGAGPGKSRSSPPWPSSPAGALF